MAKNTVIAGDFMGGIVSASLGMVSIAKGFSVRRDINKSTVVNYEIIDESKRKSAGSAVGRGLAGSLLLGPVGMLAGLSAKSKGTHTLAIEFEDGKKSMIEVDDKVYKVIMKVLF